MKTMKSLRLTFAALIAFAFSTQNSGATDTPQDSITCMDYTSEAIEKKPPVTDLSNEPMVFVYNLRYKGEKEKLAIKEIAMQRYIRQMRTGYGQVGTPNFVVSDSKANAIFAIGGYVEFRTGYNFMGNVDNTDFVTYDIPISYTPADRQALLMDASTSRIYFKSLINTKPLGTIEAYIETDFRGTGNSLRLREAYVKFKGLTFGQTVSAFCDLDAAFNTIDFEGPNAYSYRRNLAIQYNLALGCGWSMAAALEMPTLSATYDEYSEAIPQRIFDVPLYVQYAWNEHNHLRLSGILRTMNYYNTLDMCDEHLFGWGVQFSGRVNMGRVGRLFGMMTYGEGIAQYIQDLQGTGMDLVPNCNTTGKMSVPQAMAWFGGMEFNLTKRLPVTIGYSQVHLFNNDGAYDISGSDYKLAQYIVGNIFYNISSGMSVGMEYLYGTRYDYDGAFGTASRVQAAIKLNF
ncbi:MAG: DcaP family trimeric outer membrane transporter [Rikenellaceae bacterium]